MKQNRIYSFDILRALAILWIVGIWHLPIPHPSFVRVEITYMFLAAFTFISGYFLKKYKFGEFKDWIAFYSKRLVRFYFLFAVACACFWIIGYYDNPMFVKTILGCGSFGAYYPLTLWYMSMLIVFYAITPAMKIFLDSPIHLSLKIVSILFVAFILHLLGAKSLCDLRLAYYFPFYAFGLLTTSQTIEKVHAKWQSVLLFSIIATIAVYLFSNYCYSHIVVVLILCAPMMAVVYIISYLLSKNILISKFFYFVSFASMAAYMFHRMIYHYFSITIDGVQGRNYIMLCAVPIVFICAYFIQKSYNILTSKF